MTTCTVVVFNARMEVGNDPISVGMGQPFREREIMKTVWLVLLTAGLVLCPGVSVERAWSAEGDDGGHRPPKENKEDIRSLEYGTEKFSPGWTD